MMLPIARISSLLLPAVFVLALVSCGGSDRVLEESRKIGSGVWRSDEPVLFSTNIRDTTFRYNLYIDIRNDLTYGFSNLYLFLETTFPNEYITRDTIECLLASYDGKWLGSGSGNIRFNRFLFQHGIHFPDTGMYRFALEQAMRVDELTGIRDVGLCIERVNPSTSLKP